MLPIQFTACYTQPPKPWWGCWRDVSFWPPCKSGSHVSSMCRVVGHLLEHLCFGEDIYIVPFELSVPWRVSLVGKNNRNVTKLLDTSRKKGAAIAPTMVTAYVCRIGLGTSALLPHQLRHVIWWTLQAIGCLAKELRHVPTEEFASMFREAYLVGKRDSYAMSNWYRSQICFAQCATARPAFMSFALWPASETIATWWHSMVDSRPAA